MLQYWLHNKLLQEDKLSHKFIYMYVLLNWHVLANMLGHLVTWSLSIALGHLHYMEFFLLELMGYTLCNPKKWPRVLGKTCQFNNEVNGVKKKKEKKLFEVIIFKYNMSPERLHCGDNKANKMTYTKIFQQYHLQLHKQLQKCTLLIIDLMKWNTLNLTNKCTFIALMLTSFEIRLWIYDHSQYKHYIKISYRRFSNVMISLYLVLHFVDRLSASTWFNQMISCLTHT